MTSKWMPRAGWVLTALPILGLAMSAYIKLAHSPETVGMFVGKFGYPETSLSAIAIVELACALLYLIPATSFLGAILVTGYLGGAVATHVRVGDPFVVPFALGVFAWAGLYLRDSRLRALLPLKRAT